jgi:hypothetical protein
VGEAKTEIQPPAYLIHLSLGISTADERLVDEFVLEILSLVHSE